MKLFSILIIFILSYGCSFDNKTGIWNNENNVSKVKTDLFEEFETLSSSNLFFDKIIPIEENYNFKIPNPTINFDNLYKSKNIKYNDLNKIIFKSKKITKYVVNNNLLYEKNNTILSDSKGNIFVFSINKNKIIIKFNFYKKRFKKIDKKLNIVVENNIIYVSDNLGYLYAFNYKSKNIIWAKNYKVPFSSNLRISGNKLIAANQNNNLYFFDKNNGSSLLSIPTEETIFKNEFINNISVNKEKTFFLNTFGSLYAVDNKNMKINWFINLNQSLDLNPSNLFLGTQIINYKNNIIITTNKFTYILDANSGSIIYKKKFTSFIKPLIINDYLFMITKRNLILAFDLRNNKIIYSYDINSKISEFLNIKKQKVEFKSIFMLNNKISIFLKNSYFLKLNVKGNLEEVYKLPSKINSQPIFIDNSMLFLNKNNKLIILD